MNRFSAPSRHLIRLISPCMAAVAIAALALMASDFSAPDKAVGCVGNFGPTYAARGVGVGSGSVCGPTDAVNAGGGLLGYVPDASQAHAVGNGQPPSQFVGTYTFYYPYHELERIQESLSGW